MRSSHLSTRKEGNDGPYGNRRRIGHLAGERIVENKFRVWTQATLPNAEQQLTRTVQQLAEKPSANRPAESHNPSHDAGQHEGYDQLARSDPRPYCSQQLHI